MKMFRRRYRRTLPATIKVWLYHWRVFQFEHSRWIPFWTLRELREHYRLWRMRPAILAKPRSLMVKGQQVYYYRIGTFGQAELVVITDDNNEPPAGPSPLFRDWSQFEKHLFNKDIDHTARKLGYEL